MVTSYKKNSPYAGTPTRGNYLDNLRFRAVTARTTDAYYEIDTFYDRRPDTMAYDLYGDSGLWWVFAVRNPNVFTDPILGFRAGMKIFVPEKSGLFRDLGL
jgi:hypothetical protein